VGAWVESGVREHTKAAIAGELLGAFIWKSSIESVENEAVNKTV